MAMYGDLATARRILTELGDTWAVVGLSNNPSRAAYGVARVLQQHFAEEAARAKSMAGIDDNEGGTR